MILILNLYDWLPIDALSLVVDGVFPVDYLYKEFGLYKKFGLWRRRLILCT